MRIKEIEAEYLVYMAHGREAIAGFCVLSDAIAFWQLIERRGDAAFIGSGKTNKVIIGHSANGLFEVSPSLMYVPNRVYRVAEDEEDEDCEYDFGFDDDSE